MENSLSQVIVGTWKLISWETRDEDGNVEKAEGGSGYLIYTDDGYVSVTIVKGERPNFGSQDILGGTTEELVNAAQTYLAYVGKYEITTDQVIHKIDTSFFPNWVGEDKARFFEYSDNVLSLKTPPFLVNNKEQVGYLIWEKI